MTNLYKGNKAPDFKGLNQDGEYISLSQFKGKKLILYFYPKDNTPGCTAESCNLNDNYQLLIDKGYSVLGVSPDGMLSHQKFIAKYGLQFNLIADTEKDILKKYDAWGEKKRFGKTYMGVLRKTYVIDEKGNIELIIDKVKTKDHTNQILEALNQL